MRSFRRGVAGGRAGRRTASQRPLLLATALITVEFLAGMQSYLSQTVLPLMASELHGTGLYGPLNAAAQAPMFFMMPIGAWLLARYRVGHLILVFTIVTVAGAILCALAPSMAVFIIGTAVRAFASGALATIGMGAISRGLPVKYRQLVLAAMSGIWLVSSVLGPGYAVAVASVLGWRWAMVLYLPLLLLARAMIARQMPERTSEGPPEQVPWRWSLLLATGAAILSLPVGTWSAAAVAAGTGLMLWAARALLPAGTLRARSGRRAGLTALMVTAAVYFGATMVLSVVAHDAFGLSAEKFGLIIAAPGLLWAVAGLWTGSHPALDDAPFRRRAVRAGAIITLGTAVLGGTTVLAGTEAAAFAGLLLGAALLGVGMGSLYPDLLGRSLRTPEISDRISQDRMAGAVVLTESVGLAVATTAAYAWLGTGWGAVADPQHRSQVLYLALLPLAAVLIHRLWAAARSETAVPSRDVTGG